MSSPSRDKSARRKKVQPEKKEGQPRQHQQQQFHGLQEASSQYIHAYKAWSTGNEEMALSYFERALILLELATTTTTTTTSPQSPTSSSSSTSISKTVSSKTYHLLTARTYYWIGWIHLQRTKKILGRHSRTRRRSEPPSLPSLPSSSAEAKRAVRALLKSARIRLSLLGSSAEETRQVLNVLTEALPLLHHAASSMSSTTFDVPDDATVATTDTEATMASSSPYTTYASSPHLCIQALQDSLQLETEGDAFLRRHDYTKAFLQYQQAHDVFGDPDHGVLMGKLAFCCNKSIGAIDTSILWYRRALKAFCASVHGPNHPDCELTVQRLMDVLTSPHKNQQKKQKKKRPSKQQQQQQASLLPLATIEWYRAVVRDSVLLELEAEIAETSYGSHQLDMAYRKYQGAVALEERVLGTNHPVCENLRKQMTRLKMKTTNSASTGNDDTNLDDDNNDDDDDDDEMRTTRNVESRRLLSQLQWKCMKLKEELQGQRTVSEESIRIVSEKKRALKRNKKKTSRRDRLSLEDDYEQDLQELHLCKKRSNKAKLLVVLLDSTIGEALMMSGSGGGDARTTRIISSSFAL